MCGPGADAAMVERAMAIAARAHDGQTAKDGGTKLDHVRRVAAGVDGIPEKTVAYLHDVIEKSPAWTVPRLLAEGFGADVAGAVDAMTRREGEAYLDFCRRAASNTLARPVKRADLSDNLEQARASGRDGSKYAEALELLAREGLL